MKRLFVLLLLLLVFVSFAPKMFAQVVYEDVVEKIHYTHPVDIDQNLTIGSKTPTLKVYIWGDLDETYTKQFVDTTLDSLINTYKNKAQFVYAYRTFLNMDESILAAEIAQCTAEQNKLWTNIKPIADHDKSLNTYDYLQEVDLVKLKTCVNDAKTKQLVEQSERDGNYLGFNGMPIIVIQNVKNPKMYSIKVTGAQSLDIFKRAFIEAENGELSKNDMNPSNDVKVPSKPIEHRSLADNLSHIISTFFEKITRIFSNKK